MKNLLHGLRFAKETEVKNFFEVLRKAMKILNQHDWFPSQDFDLKTPEYKARSLSTHFRYSALSFLPLFFLFFLFVSLVFPSESQQGTL